MNDEELRRRVEQAVAEGPSGDRFPAREVLALLKERDRLQGDVEWLVNVQEERDRLRRRVAALEELRGTVQRMVEDGHPNDPEWFAVITRALLDPAVPPSVMVDEAPERAEGYHAAAPSEPHVHYDVGWDRCEHVPAALPAEVDLATWVPPRPYFSKPPAPGNDPMLREDVQALIKRPVNEASDE